METFDQLIEKINILGFTTHNYKVEFIENTNWYRFPNEHNTTLISMESLNIKFWLVKGDNYVLFIYPNSGAKSKEYTFEQAYERIKKDFEDKLTFKAFNSHLFKEVEVPKEVKELLERNNIIFNLMVSIENLSRRMEKPIYYEEELAEKLFELHNSIFYNDLEDKRNFQIFESYKYFIQKIFGIKIRNNKTPEKLHLPSEGYTLRYLETVSAYQLLIHKGIIQEDKE